MINQESPELNNSNEVDNSYLEEAKERIEKSDLPEEEKADLTEKIQSNEGKILLAGLFAAGALSYSPKAAAAGDPITKAINDTMRDLFIEIIGAAFGVVNSKVDESSKETQTALGTIGDGLNTTVTAIDEKNTQAAVMAPPDFCLSDEIGEKSKIKDSESRSRVAKLNVNSTAEKIIGKVKGTRVEVIAKAMQAEFGPGTDKENKHLDPTNITASLSIKNEDDEIAARAFVETMQTPLKDIPNMPKADAGKELTKNQLRLKARIDSRIARIKMAEQPFFKSISERRDNDGESKIALMQADVERTYADNGSVWRKELGQYANPTPNTQESAKLISFNNKLAYENLRNEELGCNLQAVLLLELLDSEEKAIKLNALSESAR